MRHYHVFCTALLVLGTSAISAQAVEYRRQPVYQKIPDRYYPDPAVHEQGSTVGEAPQSYQDYIKGYSRRDNNTSFSISGGYRVDNLDWNKASDITGTATPNILSELTWSDIQILELELGIRHTQPLGRLTGAYLELKGNAGVVFSGDNQDSDYFGDNRTQEFSRSNNSADKGTVFGLSIAGGYSMKWELPWERADLTFIPLVGFGTRKTDFRMQDGFQTIPATGAFPGLDSSYETTWKGPFLGMDIAGKFNRHRLGLRAEYHMIDYLGVGDWNLREDLYNPRSFDHKADGTGTVFNLLYAYEVTPSSEFTIAGNFSQWSTDAGTDRVFFSDFTYTELRFNEANWDSQSIRLGMHYLF